MTERRPPENDVEQVGRPPEVRVVGDVVHVGCFCPECGAGPTVVEILKADMLVRRERTWVCGECGRVGKLGVGT